MAPRCPATDVINGEVVAELTIRGRRNTTHLIRTPSGELVVQKHFGAGYEANYRREVEALRALKLIDPYDVIPTLLEVADDYIVLPYYPDVLRKGGLLYRCGYRLMPLKVVRRLFFALRRFYEHGYEILDVSPTSVLFDGHEKVTLVDFEFAYPGTADPHVPFSESQTIHGPRAGFPYTLPPCQAKFTRQSYDARWVLFTGLPLGSVLRDPVWLQRVKRVAFVPWLLGARAGRRLGKRLDAAAQGEEK